MPTTRTFECLACGSVLEFHAGSLAARCAMCEDARPLPLRIGADVPELALHGPPPEPETLAERIVARCTACTAILSAADEVGACPFCEAPTTALASPPPLLRPQGQLPFSIDEHTADAVVRAELQRAGIAVAAPRLHAVYVPWLFYGCVVKAEYDGRRGDRTSDGDSSSSVVWQSVSGFIERPWENQRVCGSFGLPGDVARRLEPWDWAFCEPYDPRSLGERLVEHTAIGPDAISAKAFPRSDSAIAAEVRYDIGGDRQEIHRVQARREDERARTILVPVWVGRLPDVDRTRVLVNGRTGEAVIAERGPHRIEPDDAPLEPDTTRSLRLYVVIAIVAGLVVLTTLLVR